MMKAFPFVSPKKWAIPMLLAVLVLVFYWRVLFDHQIFVFVDASRFFYPLWKWGSGVLNEGLIPLWNPDAQFGTPYFADPQMAYAYPPVPLLYSIFSPINAFAALIILHHLWVLLGFWFFARHQGFSAKASLFGSLTFGFSLHVVCSSWTPPALMAISWIPWIFLGVEKVRLGEKGGFLGLSFAWAMQLAAGYPVLVYLTGLAIGLYIPWKEFVGPASARIRERGFVRWKWVGIIALGGLVAVAYNLVWGLPFADFLRLSNYENGANRFHNLGWLDMATLLSPFVQGHPLGSNYHGPHYWVSTYFFGRPALCLLLWGAFFRAFKKSPWGLFLVLFILSTGATLVLGGLLRDFFPGYTLVVHSGFWISLLLFWAAWMACEAAEGLLNSKGGSRPAWLWSLMVTMVYGISFLLEKPLSESAFWFSFLALMAVGFIPSVPVRWGTLALALLLSLGIDAASLNILLDRSYYEEPPKILSGLNQGGRLFFSPILMKDAARLQGPSMEAAYDMAKQKMYPDWPLTFGREEAPIYNTLQLRNSFAWVFQAFQYSPNHSRKVLDYLNIRYVFGKTKFKDLKLVHRFEDDAGSSAVEVTQNPASLPKWFSIQKAVPASPTLEEDFTKAAKTNLDYGKTCFIAGGSKTGIYQSREVGCRPQGPNRMELQTTGDGEALLVSSETAYPGWKATVNGQAREVETINHSFRGIQLMDGEAQASFSFEPATFRLGLFWALATLGFWIFLVFRRYWAPQ